MVLPDSAVLCEVPLLCGSCVCACVCVYACAVLGSPKMHFVFVYSHLFALNVCTYTNVYVY